MRQLDFPLAYCLLAGTAWSAVFKKRFCDALAPALLSHILIVLFSGLLFHRLLVGIFGGILLYSVGLTVTVIQNRGKINKEYMHRYFREQFHDGLLFFFLFYVFCFFSNQGKRFLGWDEFSHWGIFLKESLRLDALYCMSPASFAHKDYVPAVTLFETIWCRVGGRFHEGDAYRAIQVCMFSLLLPMLGKDFLSRNKKSETGSPSRARAAVAEWGLKCSALLLVLLIPFLFNTSNAFKFYHSIYCDYAVGVLFFYCVYETFRMREYSRYQTAVITIGLSVMVLAKMTAMALLPMVILLLILNSFSEDLPSSNGKRRTVLLSGIPMVIGPVSLWAWFNRFVDRYIPNSGGGQSYDGMNPSAILEMFKNPADSTIPYLGVVRSEYIKAVFTRDVLLWGSYATIMVLIVVVLFLIACRKKDIHGYVLGGWALLCGCGYALLMYFLYLTAFGEYEAVQLASYERYMNSFLVSLVYLLVAVILDAGIPAATRGVVRGGGGVVWLADFCASYGI